MYQIGLCDDETMELDKVEAIFEFYRQEHVEYAFTIRRFSSADELLDSVRAELFTPDILFMDIYMPGKMGITAAQELREMGNSCQIIFLTASTEYALDAFRVDAEQYLVKPLQKKDMYSVLDKLFERFAWERKRYLPLRIDNRIRRVALQDIVFCEAQKKCQCIHLADHSHHVLHLTMSKLYEMLVAYPEFIKMGVSYIVNLAHVDSLNSRELLLDNGERIYLPRGSYQAVRKQYFDYYFEDYNF